MFTFYSFIKREKSSFNPIQWKGNRGKKKDSNSPMQIAHFSNGRTRPEVHITNIFFNETIVLIK